MKKQIIVTCLCLLSSAGAFAQGNETTVVKEDLWNNWFIQAGADMTLQNPYGYPFGEVFPNGYSFGVDVALGRWFTHEMGVRAKANWENGLIDTKANWLAPFNKPGVNHDKGGYLSITGDIMFDLHNILGGYNHDRRWNAQLFLRAGGVYNYGCDKGSPLIGLGLSNNFRLNDRWAIYADVAYNGVSSGFSMDPTTATGVGSGSNMYFTFDAGITYRLGEQTVERGNAGLRPIDRGGSFWKNWFWEAGADMTLYNPCEKDFADVFPNGAATGLNIGLGRWFSPTIGFRGSVNMVNMLIGNKSLTWLPYDDEYSDNHDGGGCVMLYGDVLFSAKHLLMGYSSDEKWDMYVFGRMGLGRNRAISSLSPVVGAGVGGTYHLRGNWYLYADASYKGITSEFFKGVSWSGPTGSTFNGIWDFNAGVRVKIGD